MIFNKERAKQLEARILKLRQVHKEIHSQHFPKDRSEGEYHKHQQLRSDFYNKKKEELGTADVYPNANKIFTLPDAPVEWDELPSVIKIRRVGNIIQKLRKELLAINYYNAVMNSKSGATQMIREARGTINKYDYARFGQDIEIDNLFPKSDEEIAEEKRLNSLTPLEELKENELNYHLGRNKEANTKCHEMVVEICDKISSGHLVSKSDIESEIENLTDEVGKLSSIVTDTESMDAIHFQINEIIRHVQSKSKLETL
tara:strand:- start:351 stop:1124 length:774 start_codon:yes stop_codon:yes gene_type:complete